MYRAFISSTFEDLKDHRTYVIAALRRSGFTVDPMADWTADPNEPREFSQARVDGCDLCVLMVGFRRGRIPGESRMSIRQLEYEAARAMRIGILVFMLAEDSPWPRRFDELDKDPQMRRWREQLTQDHGVSLFGLGQPPARDNAPAESPPLEERPG